jgi:hypothetical protein
MCGTALFASWERCIILGGRDDTKFENPRLIYVNLPKVTGTFILYERKDTSTKTDTVLSY